MHPLFNRRRPSRRPNTPHTVSGQGGSPTQSLDAQDIPADISSDVAQAFVSVDVALKNAGGKGMEQVYKLVEYSAPGFNQAVAEAAVKELRRWFKDEERLPILTCRRCIWRRCISRWRLVRSWDRLELRKRSVRSERCVAFSNANMTGLSSISLGVLLLDLCWKTCSMDRYEILSVCGHPRKGGK